MFKLTPYARKLRKDSTDAELKLWYFLRAKNCQGSKFKGFTVLRFWDNEVLTNTGGVYEKILEALLSPSPTPPIKGGGWKGKLLIIFISFGLLFSNSVLALTDLSKYPRIGNYYLRAGTDITPEVTSKLARYDLIVLPAEAQVWNPTLFAELRRANPDIIILAYVPTLSFNFQYWTDSLHQTLLTGINNDWWLRDTNGNQVSIWPGTKALNLTSGWAEYLAHYVHESVLSTGYWDGVFYDEVDACIQCRGVGVNISDSDWRAGYSRLFQTSRNLEGDSRIIFINGSSTSEYQSYVNGRMFESFPTPWEGGGRWEDVVGSYLRLEKIVGGKPPILWNDGDTSNSGNQNDFDDVRFGLTSTLLGGGYFGYDFGTANHGQLWWYDEYDAFLGRPKSQLTDLKNPANSSIVPSVWRRDFEKGIVLVNSTGTSQAISLREDFEKIHGAQDPVTNDGAIVSRVTLPSMDGLILLRVSEEIRDTNFPNGAFTRVFHSDGTVARTGFFAYDARVRGGQDVIITDLESDGTTEAIGANAGRVDIWNSDGTKRRTFAPYGDNYRGIVHLAIGDVNGDGSPEIVTGTGSGGGPHVRVFNRDGHLLNGGFFAYDPKFRGGVEVAVGDIDGDGRGEIIAGAGFGGGPHVRVFRADGTIVNKGFFAYDERFRGGVHVATGDLDGDGKDEIITGAGRTGGPHVRIFSGTGQPIGKGFFPYDAKQRNGVKVGAVDLDGDGKAEIFAFSDLP